jgi:hypothetical protein
MAIVNINTIQENLSLSPEIAKQTDLTLTDTYIKQALANLGQRTGAKGDSIETFPIRITDFINVGENNAIFAKYNNRTDSVEYYTKDNETLHISNLNPLLSFDNIKAIDYIGDCQEFIDCKISKSYRDEFGKSTYFFLGLGKAKENINSNITNLSTSYIEIVALEFDADTNVIKEGFIVSYPITERDNKLQIAVPFQLFTFEYERNINIKKTAKRTQSKNNPIYLKDVYETFSDCLTVSAVKDKFFNVNFKNCEELSNISTYERYFQKFNYYETSLTDTIKDNYNEIRYNEEKDKNLLYNSNQYNGLKDMMFSKLVKTICDDYSVVVIFPEFEIHCFKNDNTGILYYTYDIPVKTIIDNTFDDSNDLERNYIYAVNITDPHTYYDNKITIYRCIVDYINDNDYVDDVDIKKVCVLPYITQTTNDDKLVQDTWVIDGINTGIRASGKDAGNPNIIIIGYTAAENDDSIKVNNTSYDIDVIHTYSDEFVSQSNIKDLFSSINEEKTEVYSFYYSIDNVVTNNVTNSTYKFDISLPKLEIILNNVNYKNIFLNSLIFAVVDIKLGKLNGGSQTLQDEIHKSSNSKSYITVFWHIVERDGNYEWEVLMNPAYNNKGNMSAVPALDLGSFISFKDIVEYYVNSTISADRSIFRWIVFEERNTQLKNTDKLVDDSVYPIFKVDGKDMYNLATDQQYENDMTFVPKFLFNSYVAFDDNNNISAINEDKMDNANATNLEECYPRFFKMFEDEQKKYIFPEVDRILNIIPEEKDNELKYNIDSINDYIPDANDAGIYPLFDFKEVFVNNETLLNRLSVLTVGNDKKAYHLFIGHDGSDNKHYDITTIGTSHEIYNIRANKTLTYDWNKYNVQRLIRFNIPIVSEAGQIMSDVNDNFYMIIKETVKPYDSNNQSYYIKGEIEVPGTKYMSSFKIQTLSVDISEMLTVLDENIFEVNENPIILNLISNNEENKFINKTIHIFYIGLDLNEETYKFKPNFATEIFLTEYYNDDLRNLSNIEA